MHVLSEVDLTEKIARINDKCRTKFVGCLVVVTANFRALSPEVQAIVLHRIRTFTAFTEDNDPHTEHDFGSFEFQGTTFNWQFAYYGDANHTVGSEDPSDETKTWRVLTIGTSEEW